VPRRSPSAWVGGSGKLAGGRRLAGALGYQVHEGRLATAAGSVAGPHPGIEARGLGWDGQGTLDVLELYPEEARQLRWFGLTARVDGEFFARATRILLGYSPR
jgi:hypothetical protein